MNVFTHDEVLESLVESVPKMKDIVMSHKVQGADADDIVQEALISADAHLEDRRGTNLEAWFGSIVINKMKDFFRRRKREEKYLGKVLSLDELYEKYCEVEAAGEPVPDGLRVQMARYISPEAIYYALSKLPPKPRAIFTLCYEDQMKWTEIGESLGVSDGAVRSMVHRHKGRFAKHLREYYGKEK